MLFDVSTSQNNLLNGNAQGNDATNTAPVFVTEQSLIGFAAMTGVVQVVWSAFQQAGGPWADSTFLALAIAGAVGFAQFAPILGNRFTQNWPKILQALVFAALNTCVLWAAALGINQHLTS
jgi:hypothetical protein